MTNFSHLRIVEIGDKPFVKTAFPASVAFFATRPEMIAPSPAPGTEPITLRTLARLVRALRDPTTSLVVCHPTFYAPWQWQALLRMVFDRRLLSRPFPFIPSLGPQLLRLPTRAPVAVVDHDDLPVINPQNHFLLDRCTTYFKRELPCDHWRVFLKTAHANLPTPRFRQEPRNLRRITKLRPISLGLPLPVSPLMYPEPAVSKTADVFYVGRTTGSSTVRAKGIAELLALRDQGIIVDIPEAPLPPDEFRRRCAAAWLSWSPEGLGWDCFRHYEAAVCGSVPLINHPTIERHAPLIGGHHALYYEIEPGGLTRVVMAALADKPRLAAIAQAARAHVLTHHTAAALAAHIVTTTLAVHAGS